MKLPRHEVQTPSFALTTLGGAALLLYLMTRTRGLDFLAFACLGMAAGGIAMALGGEVERKGEEWGWRGLARALRRPSRQLKVAIALHLPQFLATTILALHWWGEGNSKDNRREPKTRVLQIQNCPENRN